MVMGEGSPRRLCSYHMMLGYYRVKGERWLKLTCKWSVPSRAVGSFPSLVPTSNEGPTAHLGPPSCLVY